ncbi:unnamed protein product [Callosobruchus maculatus]|uniref:Retinol dehydrogenase 12 n=1 Tax=Callosobruchus maculatus TaxID=64391 RepID=A0A653BY24_CALMS|nr:unnamed protein product [Callosobruchus maculatus]
MPVINWLSEAKTTVLTYLSILMEFPRKLFSSKYVPPNRLDRKVAIITGSNTGIGKYTAKDFFERGARVIMACRNTQMAEEAAAEIKESCKDKSNLGELVVVKLDLSSLKSVRNCANEILSKEKRIDLLINNAGVMMCPYSKTEDGFEIQMGTNHLGHFLFTMLLLPTICKSAPARIVNLSSVAHELSPQIDFSDFNWEKRRYSPLEAYKQSKLANVIFTKELSRRLRENHINGVNVYSLHHGVINTDLGRNLSKAYIPGLSTLFNCTMSLFFKTVEQGAQTTIYCAVDDNCANESGLYYKERRVAKSSKLADDLEVAEKLWNTSWNLMGLDNNYNPFKI